MLGSQRSVECATDERIKGVPRAVAVSVEAEEGTCEWRRPSRPARKASNDLSGREWRAKVEATIDHDPNTSTRSRPFYCA